MMTCVMGPRHVAAVSRGPRVHDRRSAEAGLPKCGEAASAYPARGAREHRGRDLAASTGVRTKAWTFALVLVSCVVSTVAEARPRKERAAERAIGASFDLDAGARMLRLSTLQVGTQPVRLAFVPQTVWGPTFGASAAVQILVFTIGGSTSISLFRDDRDGRDASAWNLDLDLGVRLPLRLVEPYFTVGLGYTRVDGLDDFMERNGHDPYLDGMNGHAVVGASAVVNRHFVVGARVEGHLLALTRDDLSLGDALGSDMDVESEEDAAREIDEAQGTSLGASLGLLVDVGWRL